MQENIKEYVRDYPHVGHSLLKKISAHNPMVRNLRIKLKIQFKAGRLTCILRYQPTQN